MSADRVLADANRRGGLVTGEGRANIAEEYAYGLSWDVAHDQVDASWRPQSITTSYDNFGSGSTLFVSWHDLGAGQDHGMRVSIISWGAGAQPRYRHVLLVEPYRDSAGRYTYGPIRKHAGGIAAYNGYLYVADTFNGLRVFDLSTILVARDDRPRSVGLHGNGDAGDYYSYAYKYVLPQVGAYDNAGLRLRFSAVSVEPRPTASWSANTPRTASWPTTTNSGAGPTAAESPRSSAGRWYRDGVTGPDRCPPPRFMKSARSKCRGRPASPAPTTSPSAPAGPGADG
ncbi:hypothetical protein [Streptomyces syringium]|uniref:hypothetical protein n=1 Tax=Streptomyces syringium TaxID=76729 RepID=UPI003442FC4A